MHQSSYKNIRNKHRISPEIDELWDEEEEINESKDQIYDMEDDILKQF